MQRRQILAKICCISKLQLFPPAQSKLGNHGKFGPLMRRLQGQHDPTCDMVLYVHSSTLGNIINCQNSTHQWATKVMSMGGKMWIFDGTSGLEICQHDIHVWPISNVIFVGAVLLHFYVFPRQHGLKRNFEKQCLQLYYCCFTLLEFTWLKDLVCTGRKCILKHYPNPDVSSVSFPSDLCCFYENIFEYILPKFNFTNPLPQKVMPNKINIMFCDIPFTLQA